ncbi:MAG: hypothetical protein P4L93_04185 [Coriobacteriia bacterium]|nr:hypothetical protein [Coriobacteriia bacterium]
MTKRSSRPRILGATLIILAFVLALGATFALADPGDSPQEALPLSVPATAQATFTMGHTWVDYALAATAGQTVRITAKAAEPAALFVGSYGNPNEPYVVTGSPVATDTLVVSFMMCRTGTFTIAFATEATGTYSVATTLTAPQPYTVGSMSAPASARHSKNFSVSARTYPAYNSVSSPIRFMIERKKGKKFKPFSSVRGQFVAQFLSGGSSKTTATFKLSNKATYRIRARFSDVGHKSASYSTWKTVKVK